MGLHYVIFNKSKLDFATNLLSYFYFVFFEKDDKENSMKFISWIYLFIDYVYEFHADIEKLPAD